MVASNNYPAICGTISPKKLTTPITDVKILASSTEIIDTIILVLPTLTPNPWIVCSDNARRLHFPAIKMQHIIAIIVFKPKILTSSQVFNDIFALIRFAAPE